jgi:hypothetical protein
MMTISRRNEDLAHPSQEDLAIDGTIEEAWRSDPVLPKRCDEGHGLPVAERGFPFYPAAARSPSLKRRHVGLGPGFIDKD